MTRYCCDGECKQGRRCPMRDDEPGDYATKMLAYVVACIVFALLVVLLAKAMQ